jgi:choline dehydrogenase
MRPPVTEQYDYLVVGAGAAGCIIAARLTEDPAVRVLLIEAGGSDRNPIITMPAALPFAYQSKRIQWAYQSGPEPHLAGKTIDEKTGRVIGGSSSINAMIYNRGNPMDYDGWAEDGLKDWDYAHCLPYFRRMETFSDGPDQWRGGDGPMHVGRSRADHDLYAAFLRSGEQAGFGITPDHNGYKQEGMHVAQSFIHDGVRWSAARGYLRPAMRRTNLRLLPNALARRIVIDNGAAAGVEVSIKGRVQTIGCAREVIVCAGAINTPKLLLLSGIGPGGELRRHGIALIADTPGVGRNLQNHPGVDIQYAISFGDSLTAELTVPGRAKLGLEWLWRRTGLGATNFFETGAFLRTRDNVAFPNMQYEFLPLTRQLRGGKLVPVPGFQFWMDLSRPVSRGAVTLRSADPARHPSIVFNHLQDRQDLQDLIDGVRLVRETLIRQPAWQRFRATELSPGPEVSSDGEIEAFLRAKIGTSYHPSGTCRMGADDDAVVDAQGRVRTVSRLRIADASIMPKLITGNLSAPVMMMAEKLADRIRDLAPLPPSTAACHRA